MNENFNNKMIVLFYAMAGIGNLFFSILAFDLVNLSPFYFIFYLKRSNFFLNLERST